MEIRRIALNGFRNYEFASAEFSSGINVISGENAQGKTNLLEAVYLLTGGRSFRTRFDRELIGFDYSGAEVLAVTFRENSKIVSLADEMVYVPKVPAILSAAVEIIPLQLFAYYVAKENGCDIDKPKNLAKSVTVE